MNNILNFQGANLQVFLILKKYAILEEQGFCFFNLLIEYFFVFLLLKLRKNDLAFAS